MNKDSLLKEEDLESVIAQLSEITDEVEVVDEEIVASQKRYDEIIKKHKND